MSFLIHALVPLVSVFSGHQNSSFYVKSCISPDGRYLLSGSSCGNAFIWQVGKESTLIYGCLQCIPTCIFFYCQSHSPLCNNAFLQWSLLLTHPTPPPHTHTHTPFIHRLSPPQLSPTYLCYRLSVLEFLP